MNGLKGKKNLKLTDAMIAELEKRNFPFNYEPSPLNDDDKFWDNLEKLSKFKDEHRHTDIPEGHKLRPWVDVIRAKHKEGKLPEDQLDMLTIIKFPLVEFREGFVHYCKCTKKGMFDNSYNNWCEVVRQMYNDKSLPSSHELRNSGFDFTMDDISKQPLNYYDELEIYIFKD